MRKGCIVGALFLAFSGARSTVTLIGSQALTMTHIQRLRDPRSLRSPRTRHVWVLLIPLGLLSSAGAEAHTSDQTNYIAGQPIELNDNGAWSWFMDKRGIVDHGRLLVGSVRANGTFADADRPGWGNVELSILDIQSKQIT